MLKRTTLFSLLVVALSSQAEPDSYSFFDDFVDNSYYDNKGLLITYYGRTYHLSSRNRNEDNNIWGFGYKGFEASTMINSFYDRSYIFSYHKKWVWNTWLEFGLRVGGITGYDKEDNPVQLLGLTPLSNHDDSLQRPWV